MCCPSIATEYNDIHYTKDIGDVTLDLIDNRKDENEQGQKHLNIHYMF